MARWYVALLALAVWFLAVAFAWACIFVGADRSREGSHFYRDTRDIYANTLPRRTGWELGDPDELEREYAEAVAEAWVTKGWPL